MNDPLAVVILAAGLGKRMKNPDLPKTLVELAGKPLLQRVLERSFELKPRKIIVIVGNKREMVEDFLEKREYPVETALQAEQLGTGHAVMQAEKSLSDFRGKVLILCGDVPNLRFESLEKFCDKAEELEADLSVMTTVAHNPAGYGRIVRDESGAFLRIVEEKDASDDEKRISEINSGVFLVDAKKLFSSLKKTNSENSQGEYYLTDIVEILKSEGARIAAFPIADYGEIQGVNTPADLEKAAEYLMKLEK